jgi:GTP-binding protein YchF
MKVALLGLPQSGKKTLFSLLTGREVPASRRPEEALEGVAHVQDARVDRLTEICQPKRTVYAENRFTLCPDAPWGEKSRAWLESARKCDLICLVIRAFESGQVYHPAGGIDPKRDREFLQSELLLADMATVDTRLQRLEKEKRGGLRPEQKVEEEALRKCMQTLEDSRPVSETVLEEHERTALRSLDLVTFSPVLCVYNVGEEGLSTDFGPDTLAISCLLESDIAAIESPAERAEFLAASGLSEPGLTRMNHAVYSALGLMSFYTQGKDECRAWTIRKGSTAPIAGGKIHTDIQRGFIRVEVIKFDDFVAEGSESAARDHGKMQTRGKDYVIEDGDVCHFLFNV